MGPAQKTRAHRQPADQRYDNAYLFGAICPGRGVGAALALPYADTDMMQLHLEKMSRNVEQGPSKFLCCSTGPDGIRRTSSTCPTTSRRSSCLPAARSSTRSRTSGDTTRNWLSNTVFENYDAIVDAACAAWRKLIAQTETITSVGSSRLGSRRSPAMTSGISRSARPRSAPNARR